MRNGNFSKTILINCSFISGSYPTYEEWKQTMFHHMLPPLCGSYPTYEEWKLIMRQKRCMKLKVLILPMRNGNGSKEALKEIDERVLILPMRNGNKMEHNQMPL